MINNFSLQIFGVNALFGCKFPDSDPSSFGLLCVDTDITKADVFQILVALISLSHL